MAYRVHKGRLQYGIWHQQFNGCGHVTPVRAWIDSGPAPPITPLNRALQVMSMHERAGKTNHWAYKEAQKIAIERLMAK